MKRFISVFFSVLFLLSFPFSDTYKAEEKLSLSAEAYVLYCSDNSEVLAERNMNVRMGMASTTKIMTSLLALEQAEDCDRVVEFTREMIAEGSSMYLKSGDRVKLSNLAAGMMTVSGNDAANAAAVAMGGSSENFSRLMNKRALKIGMKNTNFTNPSGLPHEEHYSTAYDMALLMTEAMNNKSFRELTVLKSVTVDFITPENQRVTYTNHNRLLSMYEYCIGGKTGYTKSTGRCLVTVSEKDNLRLVAVTFNAPSDWKDHIALYEYGFSKYGALSVGDTDDTYEMSVLGARQKSVSASSGESKKYVADKKLLEKAEVIVYLPPCVFAPVSNGEVLGRVVCIIDDKEVLVNEIIAKTSADYREISRIIRFFRSLFK